MNGTFDKYENYICHCGNTADSSGFETCLDDGTLVEPTVESNWKGFYSCNHCGAIFSLASEAKKAGVTLV